MSEKTRIAVFSTMAACGIGLLIILMALPTPGMTAPKHLLLRLLGASAVDIIMAVVLSICTASLVAKLTGASFGSLPCAVFGLLAAYYLPVALGVVVGVYVMSTLGVVLFLVAEFAFFRLLWGFGGFETVVSVLFVGLSRVLGLVGLMIMGRFLQ